VPNYVAKGDFDGSVLSGDDYADNQQNQTSNQKQAFSFYEALVDF